MNAAGHTAQSGSSHAFRHVQMQVDVSESYDAKSALPWQYLATVQTPAGTVGAGVGAAVVVFGADVAGAVVGAMVVPDVDEGAAVVGAPVELVGAWVVVVVAPVVLVRGGGVVGSGAVVTTVAGGSVTFPGVMVRVGVRVLDEVPSTVGD